MRNRELTSTDIEFIKQAVQKYWSRGRTYISVYLCEQWGWKQTNGALKDMACRDVLLRLERKGYISLPPCHTKRNTKTLNQMPVQLEIPEEPIEGSLKSILPISLEMVRFTPREKFFNFLIKKYHYLGYAQIIGEHVKYIAFSEGRPLACIGWGASAWKVECRDLFIGWNVVQRDARRNYIAQNTRFLILPWVRIPHLASYLLGMNVRRISKDWQSLYGHPVVLLETFVDTTKFKGTCYRASNWQYAGDTKGRGKYDRYNRASVPVKAVYIYPLQDNFRQILQHG